MSTTPPPGADLVVCEEGIQACPVRISLADKVNGPTTIWVATYDGEARAGTDYHRIDEVPVEVPAGATVVEVSVRLIADTVCETPEHFSVVLTGREFTAGATVGIIDDC